MSILTLLQVIVAVLLIAAILLQSRGAGVGGLFGGASGASNVFSAKRGVEKLLFRATVGLAIAFVALALWQLA